MMSGSKNDFLQSIQKGRTGELFVLGHLNNLIHDAVVDVKDTADEKIAGRDLVATIVHQNESEKENKNIEVKTIWNFLSRTNDHEDTSGTLGFELWKSPTRESLGWLDEMLHPERHPKAVCPDQFIFLLIAYENVFASIAFEKVTALIDRLKQIAQDKGFDLDAVPVGNQAQGWHPRNTLIIDNMWLIPFGQLEDLATVTIIGDKPRERPDIISGENGQRKCLTATQNIRYQRLLFASRGRAHMAADEVFSRAFGDNDADYVFAVIDRALSVLQSTDFSRYYSFLAKYNKQKGKVLDCLEIILLNMLAHEYPSREHDGKLYFPISYDWLIEWCKEKGIGRARKTWYTNVKLAIMFEILCYYRPQKASENPVDIKVNANNDGWKSVGYYAPVELTRERLMQADYNAQNYLYDEVKTSQITKHVLLLEENNPQKVDSAYGSDGRKIAKAKAYVLELFRQTLFEMVYVKDFALPDDLQTKVRKKMKKEKRLWKVSPEKMLTVAGRKEYDRQKPYWKEYNRLTRNMSGLAHDLYFEVKQLSNEDKIWMEGTKELKTGTRIITSMHAPDYAMRLILEYRLKKKEIENAKRREHYAKTKMKSD